MQIDYQISIEQSLFVSMPNLVNCSPRQFGGGGKNVHAPSGRAFCHVAYYLARGTLLYFSTKRPVNVLQRKVAFCLTKRLPVNRNQFSSKSEFKTTTTRNVLLLTDVSIVPIKTPNRTPNPDPITADRTVLVPQLFINSS